MTRLIIVCEGQTEQTFCVNVLCPYFLSRGVVVETPTIKHSHGGIVPWETMKRQLVGHLFEGDAFVTLLIDFYRIKDSYQFPGWETAKTIVNSSDKMEFLFRSMQEDFDKELRERFIPYIQMHEFESLLFSDMSAFKNIFSSDECDFNEINTVVEEFETPEDINNGPETAPSSRLMKAIKGYNKVLYGSLLAEEISLTTIRRRCPLFNKWVERLEQSCVHE